MNQDGDYTCTCTAGYEGKNCTMGKFRALVFFYNAYFRKNAYTILAFIHVLKYLLKHRII